MPELPEVETTRRGIAPALIDQRIAQVVVRHKQLRWPVPASLARNVTGKIVLDVRRRAKYLLIGLTDGCVMIHLGMSGSLRVLPAATAPLLHDHLDIVLESGNCLRLNDPRRFGCVLWMHDDPFMHPLLRDLGPEPLDDAFNGEYLMRAAQGRTLAVKQFLMNSRVVVGVGNIYASEALFRAGIRPRRAAGRIRREEFDKIAIAVKAVLSDALRAGGTTLRDYVNASGMPGYFRQQLFVYERRDEPCRVCSTPIKHFVQGQRSTYYCPQCQQ